MKTAMEGTLRRRSRRHDMLILGGRRLRYNYFVKTSPRGSFKLGKVVLGGGDIDTGTTKPFLK